MTSNAIPVGVGSIQARNASSARQRTRYYDFVSGPAHVFVIDADPHELDGTSQGSAKPSAEPEASVKRYNISHTW